MTYRAILFCCWLCAFTTVSAAQEVNGRIDLDVVSGSPLSSFVAGRVAFVASDRTCPEDHGTLRITAGMLRQIRMAWSNDPRPISNWHAATQPSDDETQQFRIEASDCRMDIDVRQQVRREGLWTSLLVPKDKRPSVPLEQRQELHRQFLESLLKEPAPTSEGLADRMRAAGQESRSMGSFGLIGGTTSIGFPFEDRPQKCFEAIGDYRIEPTGFVFFFLSGLPGDLNRFVIEGTRLDDNHGRLHFTRGDCRFELTVSQSVLREGRWIMVPLAPIVPKG